MDIGRLLKDLGRGALIMLGLAQPPAAFDPPVWSEGKLVLRLTSATSEDIQTLLRGGHATVIVYSGRFHRRDGRWEERAWTKTLVWDRAQGLARCLSESGERLLTWGEASLWWTTLTLDVDPASTVQVSVRAELLISNLGHECSRQLWGGSPVVVWRVP